MQFQEGYTVITTTPVTRAAMRLSPQTVSHVVARDSAAGVSLIEMVEGKC